MYEKEWNLDQSFFSEAPPEEAGPIGIRITRAPKSGKAVFTILSERLLGCWTHFFLGRTQPCVDDGCTICSPKAPRRWYGWLAGYDVAQRTKALVEVPPGVALGLKAYRLEVGNLRGHAIQLSRKNSKDNGPVVGRFAAGIYASEMLPPCPDVVSLLMRMWRIEKLEQLNCLDQDLKIHPNELIAGMAQRLA